MRQMTSVDSLIFADRVFASCKGFRRRIGVNIGVNIGADAMAIGARRGWMLTVSQSGSEFLCWDDDEDGYLVSVSFLLGLRQSR